MDQVIKDVGLWALARLREPSTYAGGAALIGALALKFGVHLSPEDAASWAKDIAALGMSGAGIIAMILKEKGVK